MYNEISLHSWPPYHYTSHVRDLHAKPHLGTTVFLSAVGAIGTNSCPRASVLRTQLKSLKLHLNALTMLCRCKPIASDAILLLQLLWSWIFNSRLPERSVPKILFLLFRKSDHCHIFLFIYFIVMNMTQSIKPLSRAVLPLWLYFSSIFHLLFYILPEYHPRFL